MTDGEPSPLDDPTADVPATGPLVPDSSARPYPVSVVALVAANCVPLIGVLGLGWEVFPILFLYWFENVVVGGLNVLKMLFARPADGLMWGAKLFMIPYFCFHYGMFTFVHGVFVFAMFNPHGRTFLPTPNAIRTVAQQAGVVWGIFAIIGSHIVSFLWNYIYSGEFRRASLPMLMTQPYSRVVVMHLVIIGGGFGVAAMGQPMSALVLLIALKTGIDIYAHLKERDKFGVSVTFTSTRTSASP